VSLSQGCETFSQNRGSFLKVEKPSRKTEGAFSGLRNLLAKQRELSIVSGHSDRSLFGKKS